MCLFFFCCQCHWIHGWIYFCSQLPESSVLLCCACRYMSASGVVPLLVNAFSQQWGWKILNTSVSGVQNCAACRAGKGTTEERAGSVCSQSKSSTTMSSSALFCTCKHWAVFGPYRFCIFHSCQWLLPDNRDAVQLPLTVRIFCRIPDPLFLTPQLMKQRLCPQTNDVLEEGKKKNIKKLS